MTLHRFGSKLAFGLPVATILPNTRRAHIGCLDTFPSSSKKLRGNDELRNLPYGK